MKKQVLAIGCMLLFVVILASMGGYFKGQVSTGATPTSQEDLGNKSNVPKPDSGDRSNNGNPDDGKGNRLPDDGKDARKPDDGKTETGNGVSPKVEVGNGASPKGAVNEGVSPKSRVNGSASKFPTGKPDGSISKSTSKATPIDPLGGQKKPDTPSGSNKPDTPGGKKPDSGDKSSSSPAQLPILRKQGFGW